MKRQRGFTLIELLVAIAVMALLAIMSWRGLDGMARAQERNKARGESVLALQTTLSQWSADLDAMTQLPTVRPLDWDGRLLRITRRGTDDLRPVMYVVAWALRSDADGAHWARWQSAALTGRDEWQLAWNRAASWAQDGATRNDAQGSEVALMLVEGWQLYYFRNNTWGPAIGAEALGSTDPLPDGVRLVLTLPPGPALAGVLTRDWVRPTAGAPKA